MVQLQRNASPPSTELDLPSCRAYLLPRMGMFKRASEDLIIRLFVEKKNPLVLDPHCRWKMILILLKNKRILWKISLFLPNIFTTSYASHQNLSSFSSP
jgi:hypothetical protein